jgi:choline dehydrogenase-like flavoprotein
MIVVVGSGPAGIACSWALAERGHEITILDAGRGPNPEIARKYEPLSATDPEDWDPALVEELRGEFSVNRDELPPKPVLGSLHPYAPGDPSAPAEGSGVGLTPSLGRGGLSAVWGAAMLPYRERDLVGWPLGVDDLAPFYKSVLDFMPVAGRRDRLESEFPLYTEELEDLEPTAQIRDFLSDLERGAPRLNAAGLTAGRARLAVRTVDSAYGRACGRVGLCLHGCPLGAIWSAEQSLAELLSRWRVRYLPGRYVERVEEDSTGATVTVRTADGLDKVAADRVFVGAGALPTTRLMLRSLDALGTPVELYDSQYYTFPLIRVKGPSVSVETQGNTLAQAFIEVNDDGDPCDSAHLQVYGFNDLMLREVAAMIHIPPRTAARLLRPVLSRILFCQGYLHSDRSRSIRAIMDGNGPEAPLRLSPLGSAELVKRNVKTVVDRVGRSSSALRAAPLRPLLRIWEPGRGIHTGGSFPMRANPSGLECDLLGRPAGLRRIHLVDSSVFPSIPPTTITYTVMANAQRIAAEFSEA